MNQRKKPSGAAAVRTWRERIGAGPDFPLHAPNEVERAMEAEIAELRGLLDHSAAPNLKQLIADDSYAASFQCMGRYRGALLRTLAAAKPGAAQPEDAA